MEASTTTAIEERPEPALAGKKYDDPLWAERYASYWEPVLAPAGRRLLDALARDGLTSDAAMAPPSGTLTLLDVGTGTGLLAIDAAQRWAGARIIGVDPSAAMVAVARRRAAGLAAANGQLEWHEAPADRLPIPDQAVDLAVSSFVFQLVPKRLAALRETFRVLRPGGLLGYVTWIKMDEPFVPRDIVDEEVGELAASWGGAAPVAGDVASVGAAARQLRRAGFQSVRAWQEELSREWTPAAYLEYVEACRNADAFASLDADARTALRDRLRARLARLPSSGFNWSAPIVFAIGRRPG
ncbi:MAG: methyltransferase domain-containing protein [Chloroflexi bacterium]|nr:methyltransferase domain-containing protein [Chloroflexota bacterium]